MLDWVSQTSRSYPYSESKLNWHPLFRNFAVKAVVDAQTAALALCDDPTPNSCRTCNGLFLSCSKPLAAMPKPLLELHPGTDQSSSRSNRVAIALEVPQRHPTCARF